MAVTKSKKQQEAQARQDALDYAQDEEYDRARLQHEKQQEPLVSRGLLSKPSFMFYRS